MSLGSARARLAPGLLLAGLLARGWVRRVLLAMSASLYARRYLRTRRAGEAALREEQARARRVQPGVLETFYSHHISSMEEELREYPAYDRHRHERRYQLVAAVASRHATGDGLVVDVGSASGVVLDLIANVPAERKVGFDLSFFALRQRLQRAHPPLMARAAVEAIPLPDGAARVVVLSEVIEHVVSPAAALVEVARILRPGGVVVLTTNNASEMPVASPLQNPGLWVERLLGRWWPGVLSTRVLTWPDPVDPAIDPHPADSPTHVPHAHLSYAELRDAAASAGLRVKASGSFEFPAPQSPLAGRLRDLATRRPGVGLAVTDGLERVVSAVPGLNLMGTHNYLLLEKPGAHPGRH